MLQITSHMLQVNPVHNNLPKNVLLYATKMDMRAENSALRDKEVHWLAGTLMSGRV